MTGKKPKSLYLLDGTAIAYRSYFAFIKNPLINSRGLNTGAIYGFITILMKLLKEVGPDYIAAVFDSKEPTFRHKIFKEYKATREKMPDDMADQLPYIEQFVRALSIPFITFPSYEADDIMATLARQNASETLDVYLVTGDKDLAQVVSDHIKLYTPKKGGEVEIVGKEKVKEKFGVAPSQIVDLFSLMGDSSDNIPGVPGIGEKTALKLISEFSDLDTILANPELIENIKLKEKIIAGKDSALSSKKLVTIDSNVPINIGLEDLRLKEPDENELIRLFKDLEFHSFIEKMELKQSGSSSSKYTVIETEARLDELIAILKKSDFFILDTETTGLNPLEADLVGISFCSEEKEAYYLPFKHPDSPLKTGEKELLKKIRPLFEDEKLHKGGHNIKYDYLVLKSHGVETKGITCDTMIESYLLDPSARQHNLDLLAAKHLNHKKISTESLIGSGKNQISMAEIETSKVAQYSCEDADMTTRLHKLFLPKIEEFGLTKLYSEVEIPLLSVLASMEWEGITLDSSLLKDLAAKADKEIKKIALLIHREAGEEFNINSPRQLGKILFEKLKIHEALGIKKIKKTKTGYSTDSSFLETLSANPIVAKIMEFKNLSKLKSTYLDSLPDLISAKTGRIHTSFNQTVTATGRLSSSDPNLQNIPIRTETGRQIRKAFIPRDTGWSLVSADYSQIELRILAHLTRDENLIKTFQEGVDVHRRTAATIFGVPDADVSSELRNRAKAINFGIIYGMGPQRLARETNISFAEAEKFIGSYFEKYPGIKRFIDSQIAFAREHGYVTTLLDRRRYIPDIISSNPRLQINAEHIAVNTPIQGSAADMIKIAMINIHSTLFERSLKARMILQVHDELVFDVPDAELNEVRNLVVDKMENAMKLDVPIRVEIKSGKNWFEAH